MADLQQLAVQYQAVTGSVDTSTTPSVQYNYNLMAGGANNSNLTSVVYPNGRIVDYDYSAGQLPVTGIAVSGTTATVTTAVADGLSTGATVVIQGSAQAALNGTFTITVTSSTTFTYTFTGSATSDSSADITETPFSLDTAISRPDGLQDQAGSAAGTVLQGYTYLGLGTVVQQNDGNGAELSYIQQSGDSSAITSGVQYGGDQYTGLDSFGRVIDQNWIGTDRFQYNYDADSNVLYSNNLIDPAESQLYHANSATGGDDATAYDPLGRLTSFERGTLSASGNNGGTLDTVSSPTLTKSYALDAVGNQSSVTTNGTPVSNTTNSQNELTANGGNSLTYDNDGNTTTDQAGDIYTYDAWNHAITSTNPTTNYQVVYSYNALGDRVTTNDSIAAGIGPGGGH